MRLPTWLAWALIRLSMEIAVIKLRWRGMSKEEARRLVAESALLYMHKNVTPQFGNKQ